MYELTANDACALCGPVIYFASEQTGMIPHLNSIRDDWALQTTASRLSPFQLLLFAFYHYRIIVPDAMIDDCLKIWAKCTDAKNTYKFVMQILHNDQHVCIARAVTRFACKQMNGHIARTSAKECKQGFPCFLPFCMCSIGKCVSEVPLDMQMNICAIYKALMTDDYQQQQTDDGYETEDEHTAVLAQDTQTEDGYETEDEHTIVLVQETPRKNTHKRPRCDDDDIILETPQKKVSDLFI